MQRQLRFLLMFMGAMILSLSAWAQKKDCYVIDPRDTQVVGESLTADRDGNLTLVMGGGQSVTYKKGQYKSAHIPKPKEVVTLEQAMEQKKTDYVLKEAPAIFAKYQYLGWGGHTAALEGQAQLEKSNYQAALQCFDRSLGMKDQEPAEALTGKVMALIGLKRNPEALALVEKLVAAADDKTAPYAFNARGQLLASEGKKREAVLEYLKTLLLFKPEEAVAERAAARKAVVALLKEMGDPRAAEFEKIP